jgi:hypothetical protein
MAQQSRSGKLNDNTIPLGDFDDSLGNRHAGLCACLFLFNEILDPIKLRETLETLIERPGWRKLGSRIRNNVRWLKLIDNAILISSRATTGFTFIIQAHSRLNGPHFDFLWQNTIVRGPNTLPHLNWEIKTDHICFL